MDYPLVRLGPAVDLAPPRRFEALRSALEQRLSTNVPGAEGQLAAGLLLGSDVAIPQELRAQLRASGTSHILAVSGFNVAVVGGVVLALGGRVLGRHWALALAGLAVSIYTMLVGAPPSAVRAALMLGAVGLASAVGRLPDPPTSLILAAALMGAIEPLLLLDIGFQLSFAATAGLVLLGSSLTPTWRRLPRWVGTVLGMTLAAQLFTLPLVLHTFHSVSLVAPLANVLVAPLLPALMGSAALDLMLGWVPALGPLLHGLVWLLSHVVLTVIGSAAGLPGAMLATGRFPVWALLAAYGCILGALAMRNLSTPFGWFPSIVLARAAPAVGLAALAVVAHLATARAAQPEQLRALFFDAAGDGLTLLESPSGHRVLVGSAGSPLAVAALAEQLPLLDRAIDLLVVTRTGARDLDGLGEIVRRYPIGLVLQPGAGRGDSWSRWNALLAERSIPTSTAWPGAAVELGDVLLELDGVVEESAERLPSLSMRLLYGALDLRLVGGVAPTAMEGGKTVVVRLAPEIALNRELAERLVVMDHRVAVVGGRASLSQVDGPIRMPLANADLVELASDGTNTRIWRTPCGVGHERCVWP
jgi:competence protein ComEC